jgi:RNA polymerase sigma-70 factor (ECF subfamily)
MVHITTPNKDATARAPAPDLEDRPPHPPQAPPDDAALLAGLRQHYPEALEELVRRYRGRILRRAARHVGSHADAEDLAQEVLIKIYLHIQRFEGNDSLWPWIARITSNAAISLLRTRKLRESREHPGWRAREDGNRLNVQVEPPDPSLLADELAIGGEIRRRLLVALRGLPVVYRDAVILKDLHGYTSAETSRFLRVPVPTVKSRVNRGRRLLKQTLSAFDGGPDLRRSVA